MSTAPSRPKLPTKIEGKNANAWLSSTLGGITVALMSLAGGFLIWPPWTGKAS